MNTRFALTFLGLTFYMLLSGCITTSSNSQEKWGPESRAETHVDLGMHYLRNNQLETARSEFNTAIAINSRSDAAYHAEGLLLARIQDNEAATKSFAKAVSINQNNFMAANDYGIHLCQQNQVSKGIKQLKRIEHSAENHQSLSTQLGLGVCYFRDKQFNLAESYFRVVLDQSPILPQALLPMAEINYKKNDFLHARGFLERYFGSGSLSERSLFLAAMVEIYLEDEIKANQYRRELMRQFPLSELNIKLDDLLK